MMSYCVMSVGLQGGGAGRVAWRTPPVSTQSRLPMNSADIQESSGSSGHDQHSGQHLGHDTGKLVSGHHSTQSGQQAAVETRNVPLASRTLTHPQPLFPSSHLSPPPSKSGPLTSPTPHVVPLTGDPRADADILAFYRARQHLINNRGGWGHYIIMM